MHEDVRSELKIRLQKMESVLSGRSLLLYIQGLVNKAFLLSW